MTFQRSGLTALEIAILAALDEAGATAGGSFVGSRRVIRALAPTLRLRPAYLMAAELSRPDLLLLPLVEGDGILGAADWGPGPPESTGMRLSPVGELALRAERGDAAPIPLGLINGDWWSGGIRPSHDPRRVLDALIAILENPDITDTELVRLVGPPLYAGGCELTGDFTALAKGEKVDLRLRPVFRLVDEPHAGVLFEYPPPFHAFTHIENFPISVSQGQFRGGMANRAPVSLTIMRHRALPISDLHLVSDHRGTRMIAVPRPGVSPNRVVQELLRVPGMSIPLRASYGMPLAQLLRLWVELADDGSEQLHDTLHELEGLLSTTDPIPASAGGRTPTSGGELR